MVDFFRAFGRSTFSSLAIRNYRLYFIGQSISLTGTWMQTVALGWLVLVMTGSGSHLGITVALQFVPILFLGPWGGTVVDRLDTRKILYWTQVSGGVIAGLLSIVVFTGLVQLWMIYVCSLLLGLTRVFDNPARQIFASEMVGEEHLKNAISLNSTANNLARAVGPSIGGIIIAVFGIAFCFLFNAFSYIATIYMLYMMDADALRTVQPSPEKRGRLIEGFRYVRSHHLIRTTLIMMAVIGTFAYEFQVSLPILAQQTFHGTAPDYAALMTAFGIGSVIGGLFAAGRRDIGPKQFALFMFIFGLSMLGVGFSPSLHVAIIGMAVVGFFSIQVLSNANTMIQLASAEEMRGRVMALWSVAMIGSTPIGGPIVGFIGEYFGARWGLAIGGVAAILTATYAVSLVKNSGALGQSSPNNPAFSASNRV